jgi:hypothetical protein
LLDALSKATENKYEAVGRGTFVGVFNSHCASSLNTTLEENLAPASIQIWLGFSFAKGSRRDKMLKMTGRNITIQQIIAPSADAQSFSLLTPDELTT